MKDFSEVNYKLIDIPEEVIDGKTASADPEVTVSNTIKVRKM